jgi:hypothetical protein
MYVWLPDCEFTVQNRGTQQEQTPFSKKHRQVLGSASKPFNYRKRTTKNMSLQIYIDRFFSKIRSGMEARATMLPGGKGMQKNERPLADQAAV